MSYPSDEKIYDSPTGWVASHIDEYVATDGRKGRRWKGTDTLLLTTRGRKSGKLRRSALIFGREGDGYVVVASKGGARQHPAWYLNLSDDPGVVVQVGPDVFPARARTVIGSERERLWTKMAEIWPDYDNYQKKTEREIPIVVIEPELASG
jgi:deazaflavin-dependent oxidoreductase (nitroreductase family)